MAEMKGLSATSHIGGGTKLSGMVDAVDEEWLHGNVMKFNVTKCAAPG